VDEELAWCGPPRPWGRRLIQAAAGRKRPVPRLEARCLPLYRAGRQWLRSEAGGLGGCAKIGELSPREHRSEERRHDSSL